MLLISLPFMAVLAHTSDVLCFKHFQGERVVLLCCRNSVFFCCFFTDKHLFYLLLRKDQSVVEQYRAAIRLECFERAAGGTL